MSLLVVLPFAQRDVTLAEALLDWIGELCGCHNNRILLLADCQVPRQVIDLLAYKAAHLFDSWKLVLTPEPLSDGRWPLGANWMFGTALRVLDEPFLWLEPDCVPMRAGWLESLEAAYENCGLPFLGQIVLPRKKDLPERMLSGVAIYPKDARDRLLARVAEFRTTKAFDVAIADLTVPETWPTRLIWNWYGLKGQPPTVVEEEPSCPTELRFDDIPPVTVLFHRCKDGSLIRLLRRKLFEGPQAVFSQPDPVLPDVAPPT